MLTKFRARHAEYWRSYHAVATDASAGTIILVHRKGTYQASFTVGLARELPAVFTVLTAAASALQGEHDAAGYALAAAEVIAGAAVLVVIALEARHLFGRYAAKPSHTKPHSPPRVDASNLAAAALGYIEAWHRAHLVGHFKLVSPFTVGATLSLLFAFASPRLTAKRAQRGRRPQARRLHVCITPDSISYLAGPRQKWRADWTEVAGVEHGHGEITVHLHDGRRHVLRAHDHMDGDALIAETRAAITAHASHVPGA